MLAGMYARREVMASLVSLFKQPILGVYGLNGRWVAVLRQVV
jgi:hypothetical protein